MIGNVERKLATHFQTGNCSSDIPVVIRGTHFVGSIHVTYYVKTNYAN